MTDLYTRCIRTSSLLRLCDGILDCLQSGDRAGIVRIDPLTVGYKVRSVDAAIPLNFCPFCGARLRLSAVRIVLPF